MENGTETSNNGLKVLVLFLVIVIIGLVAGVVVVNVNNTQVGGAITQAEGETLTEIVHTASEMPTEEAIDYLDKQIERYKGRNEIWFQLVISKAAVYEQAGIAEEALGYLESLDIDGLDGIYKKAIYYKLCELCNELGDEKKEAYYLKKYKEYEYYGNRW